MSLYNISINLEILDVSVTHRVPLGCAVDRDFGSLLRAGVAWVLEVGREVNVFGDRAGSVDVVLIVSNLVSPRPLVEIGRGAHVIEAAIPEDCAYIEVSFAKTEIGLNAVIPADTALTSALIIVAFPNILITVEKPSSEVGEVGEQQRHSGATYASLYKPPGEPILEPRINSWRTSYALNHAL
jgi:hypothetical protein